MQLSSLLQSINPSLYKTSVSVDDINVRGIVYDSRQVQPGDLYVAVVGTQADGHNFIPQAIQQGAVTIVCNDSYTQDHEAEQVCWLSTSDTPGLLAELSAAFYDRPSHKMNMIGITGTNGKTTIAWLTSSLLNALETPTGWIGTLGADFNGKRYPGKYTTPFPPELHNLLHTLQKDGAACMVMECSSHALIQQRLSSIPFKIGIFSNLTQDHLDYHGTLQHYGEAKALLFSKALAKNGVSILNADDPWHKHYSNCSKGRVITYGINNQADFQASNIQLNQESTNFELNMCNQLYHIESPLTGAFNVYNLLAAIATAYQLGHNLPNILQQIPRLTAVPGRLERVSKNGSPFGVYVDYAHTPDSLENVLKTLRNFTTHKLHVVVGCGGDRDKSKRPIMAKIAETLADNVILTSDNPRSEDPLAIIQDMRTGLQKPASVQEAPDRAKAIALAIQNAGPGDQVLIAGKGHETYQIIGSKTFDFDDRAVAQQALAHLI